MYSEEDYLMLSGIQHFAFCRRQWALGHIENQWDDNYLTIAGQNLHHKTDDPYISETRGEKFIVRAMPVHSREQVFAMSLNLKRIIMGLRYLEKVVSMSQYQLSISMEKKKLIIQMNSNY